MRILEGDKERIQIFNGVVIGRSGSGTREMFIVRRIVQGEGVERKFPLHSPRIADIVVKRSGKVRRAKLYYLRQRSGKAVRLKERFSSTAGRRGQGRQGRAPGRPRRQEGQQGQGGSLTPLVQGGGYRKGSRADGSFSIGSTRASLSGLRIDEAGRDPAVDDVEGHEPGSTCPCTVATVPAVR